MWSLTLRNKTTAERKVFGGLQKMFYMPGQTICKDENKMYIHLCDQSFLVKIKMWLHTHIAGVYWPLYLKRVNRKSVAPFVLNHGCVYISDEVLQFLMLQKRTALNLCFTLSVFYVSLSLCLPVFLFLFFSRCQTLNHFFCHSLEIGLVES